MEKLFEIIKEDNIVEFERIVAGEGSMDVAFGRFPILSVCYLYNAKKIILKYEADLLKIKEYIKEKEPLDLFVKFLKVAKKEARIYAGKDIMISPIEMLYILGKMEKVESIFEYYKQDGLLLERLKKIELIRSQKELKVADKIVTIKPKLTKKKKLLLLGALAMFICMIMVSSYVCFLILGFGIGTTNNPIKITNAEQFAAYLSKNVQTLNINNDLQVQANEIEEYSGTINGCGNTITIKNINKALFKEFRGTLQNINIVYEIEDYNAISDIAGICLKNSGTIKDVSVEIKANFTVTSTADAIHLSIITDENIGQISKVQIDGEVKIVGNAQCNATFSPICKNSGTIDQVKSNLSIDAIDCDISGLATINNYEANITNCEIAGKIEQTGTVNTWNPNLGGIALENYGRINNCTVLAAMKGISLADSIANLAYSPATVLLGGIATNNRNEISKCKFSGTIYLECDLGVIIAGAVSGIDESNIYINSKGETISSLIDNCIVDCDMEVKSSNKQMQAAIGGISGAEESVQKDNCINLRLNKNVPTDSSVTFYAGALTGQVTSRIVTDYMLGIMYLYNNYFVETENIIRSVGTMASQEFGATKFYTVEQLTSLECYWQ